MEEITKEIISGIKKISRKKKLSLHEPNFKKKTCLDIGTRDGLNCVSLIK